jgi:hypothetical protein
VDSKDYGQECLDILMQVMENERDKLVVILAGYKDRAGMSGIAIGRIRGVRTITAGAAFPAFP